MPARLLHQVEQEDVTPCKRARWPRGPPWAGHFVTPREGWEGGVGAAVIKAYRSWRERFRPAGLSSSRDGRWSLDRRWYLDVNRFARTTTWAHGFMKAYYQRLAPPVGAGLLVLALLVLVAWWSARRHPQHMAAVIWTALAGLAAFGVGEVLLQVLAERPPYTVIRGAEVLVTRGLWVCLPGPPGRVWPAPSFSACWWPGAGGWPPWRL